MNASKGMAVDEVRQMARALDAAADEITQVQAQLTAGLESVDWTGPDATRFRSQWQSETVPKLQELARAVKELGETADRNAAEQDAASS